MDSLEVDTTGEQWYTIAAPTYWHSTKVDSNLTMASCVYHNSHCDMHLCSHGHELHTLTAVPRSTQPSTLHVTIK